jgi:hypothetical protein
MARFEDQGSGKSRNATPMLGMRQWLSRERTAIKTFFSSFLGAGAEDDSVTHKLVQQAYRYRYVELKETHLAPLAGTFGRSSSTSTITPESQKDSSGNGSGSSGLSNVGTREYRIPIPRRSC